MPSLFRSAPGSPGHFSVGAVLIGPDNKVAAHHFEKGDWGGNLYLFMRETLHDSETLESAVSRGLLEEWGAAGVIKHFLGALSDEFYVANEHRLLRRPPLTF